MQTKQDVLIGKVIWGRLLCVRSRSINSVGIYISSICLLPNGTAWLYSFLGRLVIERQRFRKER